MEGAAVLPGPQFHQHNPNQRAARIPAPRKRKTGKNVADQIEEQPEKEAKEVKTFD